MPYTARPAQPQHEDVTSAVCHLRDGKILDPCGPKQIRAPRLGRNRYCASVPRGSPGTRWDCSNHWWWRAIRGTPERRRAAIYRQRMAARLSADSPVATCARLALALDPAGLHGFDVSSRATEPGAA